MARVYRCSLFNVIELENKESNPDISIDDNDLMNIYIYYDDDDNAVIYNNFNYNFDEDWFYVSDFKPAIRYFLESFDEKSNIAKQDLNKFLTRSEEID